MCRSRRVALYGQLTDRILLTAEEIDALSARQTELRGEVTRLASELADAKSSENNLKVGHCKSLVQLPVTDPPFSHCDTVQSTELRAGALAGPPQRRVGI